MDAKNKAQVTIIIISFNTKEMTLSCLESIYQNTSIDNFEVIVLDNNSSDGSADAIAQKFSSVKLIRSNSNHGFALGNNICVRQANSEFILLLNPDTLILKKSIDHLLAFAKCNKSAGIWGGKTLFADNSLNPNSCHQKMTLWNQFCRTFGLARLFKNSPIFASEHYGGWKRDCVREVDIVSGCFFMISLALWRELGGFSKKYFMYGEESNLCLRAQQKGYRPKITPEACIIHYGGASDPVQVEKKIKLFAAKIDLMQDHWHRYAVFFGRTLMMFRVLSRVVAYKILSWLSQGEKQLFNKKMFPVWLTVLQRRKEWLHGYSGRKALQ
ncbi:glycosyltransferase family 2 protein [Candidatus Pacearchaeota archaeon]|nr:glycosyltransferase family 2 protein [Candidatus Pacearchaeota archaeon]